MANSSNKFLSTSKVFYKEIKNVLMGGEIGIDKFLFGIDDFSPSSEFQLDRLITSPVGVVFRHKDSESHIRPYVPGKGIYYEIPHASEKTPISEQLRDSVVVGASENADFASNEAGRYQQIIQDHTIGHMVTRWYLALQTIRTGKFSPTGVSGADIGGLEIDFGRDASLDITYDFTGVGATIDLALGELIDAYRAKGGSMNNACVLMGADWLNALETDDDVMVRMQANAANNIIELNMTPPAMRNTKGLFIVGRYRVPGRLFSVTLLGYSPDDQFTAYSGATAADYMPSDEALIFSTSDTRYRVGRGIDALNDSGKAIRVSGEVVFDTYNSKDPVTEFIRSQSRIAFIPGNVDRTARSTGTFAS